MNGLSEKEMLSKHGNTAVKDAHGDHCHESDCDCGEMRIGGAKLLIFRLSAATVILIVTLLLPVPELVKAIMFGAAFLIAGFDVLIGAMLNIVRLKMFEETLLMTIAGVAAFIIGEYFEAVTLVILFQIGTLIEEYAVGNSRKSIAHLMELNPDTVEILRNGELVTIDAGDALPGEMMLIKPGTRVGLDAMVSSGESTMNTSAITGESLPRYVKPGDAIYSGFMNLSGAITAEITAPLSQSTVSRILELVETASSKKAKSEKFLTRFARYYTPAVILAAVLTAFLPVLMFGQNLSEWVHRALTFLVISCPCALVVSVPLTYFAGIGGATKNGILFKGSSTIDAMAKVKTVVFDKTGTLTTGRFRVVSVEPDDVSAESLLRMAAHAEIYSEHPLAQAVCEAYRGEIIREAVTDHQTHAGLGVSAKIKGMNICCGNLAFMESLGVRTGDDSDDESVIYVAANGRYAGRILLSDTLKEDASAAIFRLQSMGCDRIIMLSGDNAHAARKAANALGISEFHAECLPADKASWIEKVLSEKKSNTTVAYVGDGINDAPVLAMSDVGISMGSIGTDSAIEASDVVIMNDAPVKVAEGISVARATDNIVRQNIIFSLVIKAAIMAFGIAGLAPLWLAVLADVGVLTLATLNAMRARNVL